MSQENIEIVREIGEAWNRNDWAAMEASFHSDVIGIAPRGWPEAADSNGWEETRRQFERLKDSWGMERAEFDEVRDLGQLVLARFRWIVSGKASGIPTELPVTLLASFRDGKVARAQFFLDYADALEAAGLRE
jgi:ketosteroid isomerase-like protein